MAAAPPLPPDVAGDPLWYKDAVIYELHIKAFFDANGDGLGDFAGLIAKLDHVRELGVNTIWLLPFYPSPFRDDGYDVADFMAVHPAYGSVADVARLVQEAHARGLRIITELVVNHTSDRHPWFQAARRAPRGTPERDFYVWSDDPQRYAGTRIIFTDTEQSNWTWDEVAGQYYWHRFFSHQPDLNFDNPAVLEAVFGVMEFWLAQGVDGFRLDAIPYLVEREGTGNENLRETHAVIKELRRRLDARYPGRLLLAEANMWPEDVREYFGDGDECHMAYHFPLMPRMYMAIAQEDRHPVVEILAQTPDIPAACQWAIFLRNHDELTLEMVTSRERDYMYTTYAVDPRARINLGIRRRLAPLLDNDRDRIKLMNSLLLSMPGSPVLYYGDEIGMGDNIFLGDRDGVRTPMQWSSDRNGGFSRADPQRLYLPPIQDPVYGYEAVNVEAQSRDVSSLLNWTRRMLAVRRSSPLFGRGRITLLHPGNRKVLAYLREGADDGPAAEAVLCVANLSRSAQPVELDLARYKGRVPVEMGGHIAFPPVGELPYLLTLPAHGFFWFRLATDVAAPDWHAQRTPAEDLAVLVLFDGWNSLFRDRVVPWRIAMAIKTMAQFETEVLPRYLARQHWYGERGAGPPATVRVADHALLADGGREWLLALLADGTARPAGSWFLPLAVAWEAEGPGDDDPLRQLAPAALAKVRMQARVGVMADALADPAFGPALVQAVEASRELRGAHGSIRCRPTPAFAAVAGTAAAEGPRSPALPLPQGSNSTARAGPRVFLKLLRQVQPGPNAELELGRHLTEVAAFEHVAPLAGWIEHVGADGSVSVLALLQAWVTNQGTAWTLAVEQLTRELERAGGLADEAAAGAQGGGAGFATAAGLIGRRIAGLHAALALRRGDAGFDPEPAGPADLRQDIDAVRVAARDAAADPARPPGVAAAIERALARAAEVPAGGLLLRIHGACRLQELLLAHNDFVIVDFGGDPARPPHERRRKRSPLRDVASLLHSFDQVRQAALQAGTHAAHESQRREALSATWLREVRQAFEQAYADTAVAAGLWPDPAALQAQWPLVQLFELEYLLREHAAEALRPAGAGPAHAALAAWAGA